MKSHFSQVTIEVVDGLEGHEPEKGLRKESKPNWATPNWRNWWPRSPSLATHQTGEHDRTYGSNSEDSNFLRPPAEWDRRGGTGGGSKAQAEYGEDNRRLFGLFFFCFFCFALLGKRVQKNASECVSAGSYSSAVPP